MPRTNLPRPTDAELEILRVLWDLGPSTVRDVHTTLERRREIGYTTVLKLMQIMAAKGLVERDETARSDYGRQRPRRTGRNRPRPRLQSKGGAGANPAAIVGSSSGPRLRRLGCQAHDASAVRPQGLHRRDRPNASNARRL